MEEQMSRGLETHRGLDGADGVDGSKVGAVFPLAPKYYQASTFRSSTSPK